MDKAKKTKIGVMICNIIFVLLLLPSLFISAMSGMMFDAPGSENSTYTILLFSSVVSFPLLIILSIPFSGIFYKFQKYNISLIVALSPLLSIIFFALSLYLLGVMCNGNFVC
ncbi:hypothetical protein HGA92_00405 [Candidatus Gracilibacteria bacterium]|nr:hypothetical protein [Candidatus Gracilibacteria bacterium]NUJ98927.1 hypothetical protein [Candidatus Gracilibacteria bacterium]